MTASQLAIQNYENCIENIDQEAKSLKENDVNIDLYVLAVQDLHDGDSYSIWEKDLREAYAKL